MRECGICYETKLQRFLPCNHSVCYDCYERLEGYTCPYCRAPFREPPQFSIINENDPDNWLDYNPSEYVTYSRYLRNGNEIIRVFRRNEVPSSWRNDDLTTVVRRRKLRRNRFRRRRSEIEG